MDDVVFVVRGTSLTTRIPRRSITKEISPVIFAMVTEWEPPGDEDGYASPSSPRSAMSCSSPSRSLAAAAAPRGERDAEGRYVLDGPVNPNAYAAIMDAVRNGGLRYRKRGASHNIAPELAADLDGRLEACRYADYYLLPSHVKMHLTKELLGNFSRAGVFSEPIDVAKLGLCKSDMVLDLVHLDGLNLQGLQLENSHVKRLMVQNCHLADCELALCVTANEVQISRSRFQNVKLGVFASKISVSDSSTLYKCNIRVVEELLVNDSTLQECTFRGSDEDRKERQIITAVFKSSEVHGDLVLPFDRLVCEHTCFHNSYIQMTKGGASVCFVSTRVHLLPSAEGDARMSLCLENCDVLKALTFKNMRLMLRGVHFAKPCEMVDVEFPEKLCDITFPRTSGFWQVQFRHGLQACTASGCNFEGCNLGYGQDAVSDCLLTRCNFMACRFPFLEADSPVANFSGSNFTACQIQWSGQFPHEESFVINSCWLRKWNLAGCSVKDGQ